MLEAYGVPSGVYGVRSGARRQPARARSRPAAALSPYLLALLACIYVCTAGDLIDLADHKQLPPADLLILDTCSQEIPNLRNENRPSQLPRPPAQPAPHQTLSAASATT